MVKKVKLRLRVLLAEREWEQKDLAERTTLSARTISELYNNKTKSYTKHSIDELVNAFGITDMNELMMIVDDEETDN
ncbi:helix-turn-helix transcriptional regulator [Lysinibacillus sp. Ag94]|uniref:helix-turn-helix domain-containing protein n=1 Tax=Lysinibacillus sp. Ag94 TaxID=2936682 RepID=UPI00200CC2CE|nr:helix-turn-helix transcriptional regulator [Lysinibacillus sp. Ag94]UPW81892.1 helix-turn-helix transcriptional regulator [Lysinibacillus sp. Ag94]